MNLTVVLHHPRNTLNIGAVARAMSNFGVSDLRLVDPFHKDYREAPSATGPALAVLAAAREYPTLPKAIADCTLVVGTTGALGRAWLTQPDPLEGAAAHIRTHLAANPTHRAAMLFGSEKTGLSNDDLSLCHTLLRIPTRDEHASMNLGQAAAVCLYELSRTAPVAPPPTAPAKPPMADLLRLDTLLADVLQAADYPGLGSAHRARQLRLLTRRLGIPAGDAPHWAGLLRHILWKLRPPGHS